MKAKLTLDEWVEEHGEPCEIKMVATYPCGRVVRTTIGDGTDTAELIQKRLRAVQGSEAMFLPITDSLREKAVEATKNTPAF